MTTRNIWLYLSTLILAGCAMTYTAPTTPGRSSTIHFVGTAAAALDAAQIVLFRRGFQVIDRNDQAGTISTAMRNFRVTPEQADCGKTAGLDYLADPRTATRVAVGVMARDATLTVTTAIEGEYKVGGVASDIVLTCVSRGALDRELAAQILATLPPD